MARIDFDSSQVTPSTGTADALPAGWYNVMMDESDIKPTSKSTPDNPQFMLACRFNILDGQYQGRKLFTRLNIRNSNPQAVEIAYKDLAAICHSVGMIGLVQDSTMLHGKPLKVKVKLRAATGEYEASNEISAYKNINEQVGGAPAGAPMGLPGPGVTPPPQNMGWQQPQGQQPAPAGYAPQQGYAPGAGAPAGYGQPAPTGQPGYAPQQPQQPQQQWAPPAGQQPWAGQPQGAPQGQPQGQPQYAPPAGAPQPQPQGNPNPMAGQPPPWQQ